MGEYMGMPRNSSHHWAWCANNITSNADEVPSVNGGGLTVRLSQGGVCTTDAVCDALGFVTVALDSLNCATSAFIPCKTDAEQKKSVYENAICSQVGSNSQLL